MTYQREIPRDLFNEASLLKCLGQLYIKTEKYHNFLQLHYGNSDYGFSVFQDGSDGSIHCGNISIIINNKTYDHKRPLNSRDPWPLWLSLRSDPDADEFEAFDDQGNLSSDLLALLDIAQ